MTTSLSHPKRLRATRLALRHVVNRQAYCQCACKFQARDASGCSKQLCTSKMGLSALEQATFQRQSKMQAHSVHMSDRMRCYGAWHQMSAAMLQTCVRQRRKLHRMPRMLHTVPPSCQIGLWMQQFHDHLAMQCLTK